MDQSSELYRSTAVGSSLVASLNTMLGANELSVDDALIILKAFDQNYEKMLRQDLTSNPVPGAGSSTVEAKGTLASYNAYKNTWAIEANNLTVTTTTESQDTSNDITYKRARLMFCVPNKEKEKRSKEKVTNEKKQKRKHKHDEVYDEEDKV